MSGNSNDPSDPTLAQEWGPKTIRQLVNEGQEVLQEPPLILEWEEQLQQKFPYVSPDGLYNSQHPFVTFFYTADGKLYTKKGPAKGDSHWEMSEDTPELAARYNGSDYRERMEAIDLLGRISTAHIPGWRIPISVPKEQRQKYGGPHHIVSFWNQDTALCDRLIPACLQELTRQGLLPDFYFVSTPTLGTIHASALPQAKSQELTPEEHEDVELRKNLHQMRGAEKKDAMKKLGLGKGFGSDNTTSSQKRFEKAGVVRPGQKWWALTSEEAPTDMRLLAEWERPDTAKMLTGWRTPDVLYQVPGSLTFIYVGATSPSSLLHGLPPVFTADHRTPHYQVIRDNPELEQVLGGHDRELAIGEGMLVGRIGKMQIQAVTYILVTFWNTNPETYNDSLVSCLHQLELSGYFDDYKDDFGQSLPVAVSTPIHETVPIELVTGGKAQTKELTPEDHDEIDLQKRLHTMRGAEKKDAMKKLGLGKGFGSDKTTGMGPEMKKAGLIGPGQKWWAPNSEGLVQYGQLLTEWELDKVGEWVNPDDLFGLHQSETIIYTGGIGGLPPVYYGGNDSHSEMAESIPEFNAFIVKNPPPTSRSYMNREWLTHSGFLLARVGIRHRKFYNQRVLTFWNEKREDYTKLHDCLRQLKADGKLEPTQAYNGGERDVLVSTPFIQTVTLKSLEGPEAPAPVPEQGLSDEMTDQVELYKNLHQMRGAEKKAAMKELGLGKGFGSDKNTGMGPEMKKAGLIGPGQKWWAPHSEGFEGRLDEVLNEWEGQPRQPLEWVNPDTFYGLSGSVPFIYGDLVKQEVPDGLLLSGDYEDYHALMMRRCPAFKALRAACDPMDPKGTRELAGQTMLLGRIGDGKWARHAQISDELKATLKDRRVIAIWSTDKALYDRLMPGLLQALVDRDRVKVGDFLSTPVHGVVPLSGPVEELETRELTQDDHDLVDLQKNLHTMRGQEKKDAMKKLGLGKDFGSDKTTGMGPEMRKAGLIGPGQKWWAPHSEGVEQKSIVDEIASLLTDDPDVLFDNVAE